MSAPHGAALRRTAVPPSLCSFMVHPPLPLPTHVESLCSAGRPRVGVRVGCAASSASLCQAPVVRCVGGRSCGMLPSCMLSPCVMYRSAGLVWRGRGCSSAGALARLMLGPRKRCERLVLLCVPVKIRTRSAHPPAPPLLEWRVLRSP